MKTNFFKVILPVAVITMAVASAFTTNAMTKKSLALAPVVGYFHTSMSSPCTLPQECSDVQGDFCTIENTSTRLWGKLSPSAATCNVVIYKTPINP